MLNDGKRESYDLNEEQMNKVKELLASFKK